MITDERVRWATLFYLFTFMDEKVALQAAHKSVAQLKALARTGSNVAFIKALLRGLDQHRKLVPRNKPPVLPEHAWVLPDHFDIAPWAKFQKDASETDVVAVVLSKILGFSDHELAESLGVTLGTARYRVGKGVRQLGMITKMRA